MRRVAYHMLLTAGISLEIDERLKKAEKAEEEEKRAREALSVNQKTMELF